MYKVIDVGKKNLVSSFNHLARDIFCEMSLNDVHGNGHDAKTENKMDEFVPLTMHY